MNRQERRAQRKADRALESQQARRKKQLKKWSKGIGIGVVLTVLLAWGVIAASENVAERKASGSFIFGNVHWHSDLSIELCGEKIDITNLGSENSHYGSGLLHTHGDSLIHIEGNPKYFADITLASFFKNVNIPFSNTKIYDYENGDSCPGSTEPGKLTVYLNDEPLENPEKYPVEDEDDIKVVFA